MREIGRLEQWYVRHMLVEESQKGLSQIELRFGHASAMLNTCL